MELRETTERSPFEVHLGDGRKMITWLTRRGYNDWRYYEPIGWINFGQMHLSQRTEIVSELA